MTKTGQDRSDKYAAKFDPTVIQARYTATSTIAKAAQVSMQQLLATKNGNVRSILNALGVLPIQTIQYQAFSNRLFGICNRFASITTTPTLSATATAAARLDLAKWLSYGSSPTPLRSIWNLYADMLGTCPSPMPVIA